MSENTVRFAASLERQSYDHEMGIDAQYQINLQRAKRDGFIIPDTPEFRFTENLTSGQARERKGFDRLKRVVESGRAKFEQVYTKDRSRFGRWTDPREHMFWELWFVKAGVPVIFSTAARQLDLTKGIQPEDLGQYLIDVVDGMNGSAELTKTKKRVMDGQRSCIRAGGYPGSRAPFGTERWLFNVATGRFVRQVLDGESTSIAGCIYKLRWANDGSQESIRQIFDLVVKGYGTYVISGLLEKDGLPAPGKKWDAKTVLRIARNPLYMGTLIWPHLEKSSQFLRPGGQEPVDYTVAEAAERYPIRFDNFVPDAPVSPEVFMEAQRLLDGTREEWARRQATSPDFLLGGILKCRECGSPFHGQTQRQDGRGYVYYNHTFYTRASYGRRCPHRCRGVPAERVDAAVFDALAGLLQDDVLEGLVRAELQARLAVMHSGGRAEGVQRLEKLIETTRTQLRTALRNAALLGDAALEENQEVITDFSKQITGFEAELDQLHLEEKKVEQMLQQDEEATLALVGNLRAVFETADIYRKKEILALVAPRIEVDPVSRHLWLKVHVF
jgi:hypothetical protein